MLPVIPSNGPSGYQISRSVRLRSSASAYFTRTPGSATNRTTWTWSAWVKRGTLGASQFLFMSNPASTSGTNIAFDSTDSLYVFSRDSGVTQAYYYTTQVFRDPSAWYHLVVVFDTSNATATNRIRIYVNGSQITSYSTQTTPSSGYQGWINYNYAHDIGRNTNNGGSPTNYFDGYLTEINFIDGQALTPSSFGSTNATTGVWQPAKYTGTYGTNGFYLNFSDNSAATAAAIGKDYSGNGNNWTPNNISVTAGVTYDSMTDVPTLTSPTVANFAVLNPLDQTGTTVSDGNLKTVISAGGSNVGCGSFAMTSGKWYWEVTATAINNNSGMIGVADQSVSLANRIFYNVSGGWYYESTGLKWNSSTTGASYGSSYTTNDIIGIAYDADAGSLTFYKNNTTQGVAFNTGLAGKLIVPSFNNSTSGATQTYNVNFGQRPFSYTPPSGFKALNTYNLPASTVLNGGKYMAATLYTGTLLSNSITNAGGFKPDLVWVKSRSAATDHKLTDSVRGVTKALISNTTGAETTDTQGLTAFNSNGFTVGTDTNYNNLSATYVGWQWQAGQGSTSSNTSGSITSTVSVNATAGFSVVTYTGTGANATVGHGLGVAPAMIIVKCRVNGTPNWRVWHKSLGTTDSYLGLNQTAAVASSTTVFNSQSSTTFGIGTDPSTNSASAMVAYCWAEIAGFSKFGSYTGNGSTDGPFVYCGFRPRWVVIKRTDVAGSWYLYDTARDTYNASGLTLYPNLSNAESDGRPALDILSNGFKIRATYLDINTSGGTFIYAAFAENPFANALAR